MLRADFRISAGLQLIQMIWHRLEIIHSCFRIYNEHIVRKTVAQPDFDLGTIHMQFGFEVEAGIDFRVYIYICIYISLYLLYVQVFAAVFLVEQRFVASFIYFMLGTIK